MNATQSVLFYGAQVSAEVLGKKMYRNYFMLVQRQEALEVMCAYHAVLKSAVMVDLETTPVTLLVKKRETIY